MVQVVMGGAGEFNALVYGQKHPGTLNFIENQLSVVSQNLTDAGRSFFANAAELYDRFNGADAIRAAQAAIRRVKSIFQPDVVRSLWDLGSIQNAPLTMQRWIMANPVVREAYQGQRCDGYSDTYVDMHPGVLGREHYDFRRATHGLLQDDEEHDYKVTFYLDEIFEGDQELTHEQKVDIQSTWDVVEALMSAGLEDPTSPFGGTL